MRKITVFVCAALVAQVITGFELKSLSESRSKIAQGIEVEQAIVATGRLNPTNFPGDYFYVWFCFFCNNGIQVRMTLETAKEIEKNILEKSYKEGLAYLRGRLTFIPTTDGTIALSSDISHAADVLRDGFGPFREALKSATPDQYIFVQTWRSHSYKETFERLKKQNKQVIYAARRPQIE